MGKNRLLKVSSNLNKTIILLALVRYEMIIASLVLRCYVPVDYLSSDLVRII